MNQPQKDYREVLIERINSYTSIEGKNVLVAGCGFGEECKIFINNKAKKVVGIDGDKRVGKDFLHDSVEYHEVFIENFNTTQEFDIVSSIAVLEHIQNVKPAIVNMIDLCKTGGLIYIYANPLWFSPYGHHMKHLWPHESAWIHLQYATKEEMSDAYRESLNDLIGPPNWKKPLSFFIERIYSDYYNRCSIKQYRNILEEIIASCPIDVVTYDLSSNFSNLELLTKNLLNRVDKYPLEDLLTDCLIFVAKKK